MGGLLVDWLGWVDVFFVVWLVRLGRVVCCLSWLFGWVGIGWLVDLVGVGLVG